MMVLIDLWNSKWLKKGMRHHVTSVISRDEIFSYQRMSSSLTFLPPAQMYRRS